MSTVSDFLVFNTISLARKRLPSGKYITVPDQFVWKPNVGRYFDLGKKAYLAESKVGSLVNAYQEQRVIPYLAGRTERMLEGRLSLGKWQRQVAAELRDAYRVQLLAGRGGRAAATPSDWGRLGAMLKREYKALDNFAAQIKAGMLSEAEIKARITLYGKGTTSAFEVGRRAAKEEAGYAYMRRRTTSGEVCVDCVGYAAQGWQPMGTLPPPGVDSVCGHNCRCKVEYRKKPPKSKGE